jgi:hypothetical protein
MKIAENTEKARDGPELADEGDNQMENSFD